MKSSWSRAAVAVAGIAVSLSLVTACGGEGGADAAGDGGPVTLTYWGWTKGTRETVEKYNATHKDVHVRYEEIPSGTAGGYAKIANAVKAGNAPDLVSVEYPQLPEFVSQGYLKDITGKVPAEVSRKFLSQAVQLTTLGGRNWAVPFDASPQTYYYRKDFFTRHHIAVPRTWAQFEKAAAQVRKADSSARIATFFPDDPTTFQAMVWQAGGRWFTTHGDTWRIDTTDAATKKVAGYWQHLLDEDLVSDQVSFSPQWTSSLKNGHTVGYLGAAWGAGVLQSTVPDEKGKWAAAPMPSWDGKAASGMLGGSTWAVTRDSHHVDAAVRFATWMSTSKDAITARLASGTSSAYPVDSDLRPVAEKQFDGSFYGKQDLYALFDRAADSIGKGWTWGPAGGTTRDALKDAFGKAADGDLTLTQAVAEGSAATVKELRKRGLKVSGR
ncbi:ABC transporter substrate-binding protein [Streptomyces sp. NPDC059740]|uniref:ABC transporter substrate-binding protein n=1 Tax=Streptomyces sp. NPDC059740 TaxID=3346926 RepID=UPI00365CC75A